MNGRHTRVWLLVVLAASCRRKPPRDLAVYEIGAQDGGTAPSELICSLALTHDPRMSIAGEWKYGDIPPAYKRKRCDPLAPGHAYRMEVTHATLDFKVATDGDVAVLSTAC